jgi:hypothetical protein
MKMLILLLFFALILCLGWIFFDDDDWDGRH